MTRGSLTYALVTPVRNEADNLIRLAGSIEHQTVQPLAWVIVDTGSTDATQELAAGLTRRLPFVRMLSIDGPSVPARGAPIVRAFVAGVELLEHAPDVVIKLDADLSFDGDYCERLLAAFAADPRLGLASGICTEWRDGGWRALFGTRSHVWGASRAYRWSCLQEVLPLEQRRGWDEIDSLKAQIRGWHVGTRADIPFRHHRPEGTRDGSPRAGWVRRGGEAHYMGYRFSYLLVRAVWRGRDDPRALAMVGGYLKAAIGREARCPDRAVRAHLRREQSLRRLPLRLRESLGRVV
jgi:glycosyltransferase involved in cell wall biosynthesis